MEERWKINVTISPSNHSDTLWLAGHIMHEIYGMRELGMASIAAAADESSTRPYLWISLA